MIKYLLCGFTILMIGFAAWSLINSPEERWNRESFFYNYGAFFAYAILAVLGILASIEYYRTNAFFRLGAHSFLGGPFVAMGFGSPHSAHMWDVSQMAYDAVRNVQKAEPQQIQQPQHKQQIQSQRKPRREIGYGGYHS